MDADNSPVVRTGGSIWAAGITLGARYPLSAGAWVVGFSAAGAVLGRYSREGVLDNETLLVAIGGIAAAAFLWPSKNDRVRYRSEHDVSRREAWWLIPTATAIVFSLLIAFGSLTFVLMTTNREMNSDFQRSEERINELEMQVADLETSLFTITCLALTNGNAAECERALAEYERTR